MSHAISDEVRYKLLKLISERPDLSQRELAEELGVSLGKLNYCLRALMEKGLVKARNFKNSRKKLAYAYLLTPSGIEEKLNVTRTFLGRKVAEYEQLVKEIEALTAEVQEPAVTNSST
jgi:EPS-associated MarR family transcriptional regulator